LVILPSRKVDRLRCHDPEYADFYGPAQPEDTSPDEAFLDHWLERLIHLVDTYKPSLVWFDWWIAERKSVFEPYLRFLLLIITTEDSSGAKES
jgi:alpha-L-fucosidase